MMGNLFTMFDPGSVGSSFLLVNNWVSIFLGFIFIPLFFWSSPSRFIYFWWVLFLRLHKEFKILIGPGGGSGSTLLFISLFGFILGNNVMGLFPYIFTCSSHLVLTLSLALPLWLSFMLFGWVNHSFHMFVHLVPQGTPFALMFFMVLIETISNLIRPGTLAVRLAANMIAGHLLMSLLGGVGVGSSFLVIGLVLFIQIGLLLLECAVAVIQSYVFVVLSSLYSGEVN
uniref:ATP synthase subunit a n=1 Tax=Challia fletcheri TaxID=1091408 RepID=J7EVX0_9NEOP|nr:ATP synthase F0 subunit 6 [Challia fletcheri]AEP83052.1 ATP synthase F0 subunit 6 [Challia fletcheri]